MHSPAGYFSVSLVVTKPTKLCVYHNVTDCAEGQQCFLSYLMNLSGHISLPAFFYQQQILFLEKDQML